MLKVYTINDESQHLLFYGVPELNLGNELKMMCLKYGEIMNMEIVKKYELEKFTECYHVQYRRIQSARIAKRFLDNKSFYGSILHVCYAPEYEILKETREKLKQRQKDVLSRLEPGPSQLEYANTTNDKVIRDRKRKNPALPITEKRIKVAGSDDIWNGIPRELDPRLNDPFLCNKKIGMKKHFQLPPTTMIGPIYEPYKLAEEDLITSRLQPEIKIDNKLLPTTVIKNNKVEYNKRIVFRKKVEKKNA